MADHDETKAPGMMRVDDDDVEGHSFRTLKIDADDDDVEGHSFGPYKSPTSRGE